MGPNVEPRLAALEAGMRKFESFADVVTQTLLDQTELSRALFDALSRLTEFVTGDDAEAAEEVLAPIRHLRLVEDPPED